MTSEQGIPRTNIAGFISTNVDPKSINESFLNRCSSKLADIFDTQDEYITLELQFNPLMLRAGTSAPMLTLRLFHNSNRVDSSSKHVLAKNMAGWVARTIRVPEDRVLVLFIDTRFTVNM